MRVALIAAGSRGDVQPFIALARGFQRAGHSVHIATHGEWRPYLEPLGIEVADLPIDFAALLETADGRELMARGTNPFASTRALTRLIEPLIETTAAGLEAICRGADALIAGQLGVLIGDDRLASLQIPYLLAPLLPFTPTVEFPSPLIPPLPAWIPMRSTLNLTSHRVLLTVMRMAMASAGRRVVRAGSQRTPTRHPSGQRPTIYGYSASVLPRPRDWPAHIHTTGYWFLESPTDWTPPHSLSDFLAGGQPPVYIGFGSMKSADAPRVTDVALAALRATGQRGVLYAGHGGLERRDDTDDVQFIGPTPHDWLFPKMRAAVIHGGAGTTSAALRAGLPTTIVPYLVDQPFWGAQVARIGVGPEPILRRKLSVESLTRAIETMASDREMQVRAERLGERLRAEDGVARAVGIAEEYFGRTR